MKEQNDIDQLFESKLNNQSFELKDSYLADFETKLDVYNKKGKGYVWFLLGTLCALTLLFDFTLLPKHIEQAHKKSITKNDALKDEVINNESIKSRVIREELSFEKENRTEINHGDNQIQTTNILNSEKNIDDKGEDVANSTVQLNTKSSDLKLKSIQPETSNSIVNKSEVKDIKHNSKDKDSKSSKTKINSSTTEEIKDIPKVIDSNIDNNSTNQTIIIQEEKSETPDVYIDDTIRRKVVIIDTVVQRDTIIINDTIKSKIRLFKKKR